MVARTKAVSTATRTVAKKANTVANTVASKVNTVKSTSTNLQPVETVKNVATAVKAGSVVSKVDEVTDVNKVATGIGGGTGIDFDLTKLSRSQEKAIESADNIINDHLKRVY